MSQPSPRRFRPILRQHEYSSPTRTPTTTPHQHDLFSIDPSYGRPLSAKFSPRNRNSHHETYSREEYDRTAVEVQRNPLELPARFTRVFELERTTTSRVQKRPTKVTRDEGIPQVVQRSPISKAPLGFDALLEEDEDVGTSRAFYARPNTPLPRVEFGDSEEEEIEGGSGSVMAPGLVASRSGSSSEDSDGLISPPVAYIEDPLAQRFGYMTVKDEPNPFASGSSPLGRKLNKSKTVSKKTTSFGGQFRASQPVAISPSASSSSSLTHSRPQHGHSYSTYQSSGWQLSSFDDDDGCLGGF